MAQLTWTHDEKLDMWHSKGGGGKLKAMIESFGKPTRYSANVHTYLNGEYAGSVSLGSFTTLGEAKRAVSRFRFQAQRARSYRRRSHSYGRR